MNRANCGKTERVACQRRRGLGWTLLAALLWIGGAGGAQALFFNGDFAPSQWEADPVGSNIQWIGGDGVNTAAVLEITGPATPGSSLTDLSLSAPYSASAGYVSFNWTLSHNSGSAPIAYFYSSNPDGSPAIYTFSGSSGSAINIYIPADTPVTFELSSTWGGKKNPDRLRVTDWEFHAIPESGPGLADTVMVLLGLTGADLKRRAQDRRKPLAQA